MFLMESPRVKISVSLPRDLVARIDQAAREQTRSRSRVLEDWLRSGNRRGVERELELATAAYYDSLTPAEDGEDRAVAGALSRAARRLRVGDSETQRRPPRRRQVH